MNVETLPRQNFAVPETESPEMESIFEHYSVPNEISFVRNLGESDFPKDNLAHYVRENVYRFLGEYAGYVPYATINFNLGKDDLEYVNIPISPSLKKTAEDSGPGSRAHDDFVGHQKITEMFLSGADNAVWISPTVPEADPDNPYGFVFYFSRDPSDPSRIKEYILSYPEEIGSVENSQKILAEIKPNEDFSTTSDFVQNPIPSSLGLSGVMQAVGVSNKDIAISLRFERTVREELGGWVEDYISAVFNGKTEKAKLFLTAIYNKAQHIKEVVENGDEWVEVAFNFSGRGNDGGFNFYASQQAMTPGGNCPVPNRKKDPLSPYNIGQSLKSGISPNTLVEQSSQFVCPNCEQQSPNPLPRNDEGEPYCPHCKISKGEHANQGGIVC